MKTNKIMDEICRVNGNAIESVLKARPNHRINLMSILGNEEIDNIPITIEGDYSALSEDTRDEIENYEGVKVYIASSSSDSAFAVKVLVVAYDAKEDTLTFLGFDEDNNGLVWYSPYECVGYCESWIYQAVVDKMIS